jgi:RNA polymerase sigma factor (sigma-70 family)
MQVPNFPMSPPPAEQFAARVFLGPTLRAQPDRRLVDLVRDGYDAAFEEIVRRYRRPLDRFAAAIVGGRSEDVTQDAFSKALLALRGSEAEIELRPWLYRIVRNTALNDLRDRAPAAEELPETLPGGRSVAAEAEGREELRDLMARLQALPEPQRAALVMRELEGLSHEEIAAALGVSGGAARQAIHRARVALREGMGLLIPLPALRLFAEHGAEMVKAGAATVLIAGTVGTGVAIEHHRGNRPGPEAAEAAPLVAGKRQGAAANEASASAVASSEADGRGHGGSGGDSSGRGSGDGGGGSLGSGTRSGGSGSGGTSGPSGSVGSSHSGESSGQPADDSRHSGSGNSGAGEDSSGSGSGDRHGGSSGSDGSGTSGGTSGSSGDDGGSSSGSGGGEGLDSGEGTSGSGSGEIEPEPTSEPSLGESSEDGGGSGSGTSGSGSGSGDSGTSSSGSDGSP